MYVDEQLSVFFIEMYRKDNSVLKFFFEGSVPKYIFLSNYKTFVKENGLTQIEYLPVEEKIKLAADCRATGILFDNKKLIDAAKILHTLNFINANS